MRIIKAVALAGVLAAGLAGTAMAAPGDSGVGVNLGTTGLGVEYQRAVTDNITLRGAFDYLSYSKDIDVDGENYSGDLKFTTGGLFADWHPMGNAFLVSGGAYFGKRDIELGVTPSSIDIGSTTYTSAQVGRVTGKVELPSFAPTLAVGFDNTTTRDSTWGLRFLAGLAFGSSPDVTFSCSGPSCSSAGVKADLAAESRRAEDDLDGFKAYPVVQVGLTRRF